MTTPEGDPDHPALLATEVLSEIAEQDLPVAEAIAVAQVFATLAVWTELKRANEDRVNPYRLWQESS